MINPQFIVVCQIIMPIFAPDIVKKYSISGEKNKWVLNLMKLCEEETDHQYYLKKDNSKNLYT